MFRKKCHIRLISKLFLLIFVLNLVIVVNPANVLATDAIIPAPQALLLSVRNIDKLELLGLSLNSNNSREIDFYLSQSTNFTEANKILEYFFTALTIPQKKWWVNLSPYEPDRIIDNELNQTKLGRDMLIQDYVLKQFSSSLTVPDSDIGQVYWKENYSNYSLGKIWVEPANVELVQGTDFVVINKASLTVKAENEKLPIEFVKRITHAVNNDEHFAELRQIYSALILASWFKNIMKQSAYEPLIDTYKSKSFVDLSDSTKLEVYRNYNISYVEGAYQITQKEKRLGHLIKREYCTGGHNFTAMDSKVSVRLTRLDSNSITVEDSIKVEVVDSEKPSNSSSVADVFKRLHYVFVGINPLLKYCKPKDDSSSFIDVVDLIHKRKQNGESIDVAKVAEEMNVDPEEFKEFYSEYTRLFDKALNDRTDIFLSASHKKYEETVVKDFILQKILRLSYTKFYDLRLIDRVLIAYFVEKFNLFAKLHNVMGMEKALDNINSLFAKKLNSHTSMLLKAVLQDKLLEILIKNNLNYIVNIDTNRNMVMQETISSDYEFLKDNKHVHSYETDYGSRGLAGPDGKTIFLNHELIKKELNTLDKTDLISKAFRGKSYHDILIDLTKRLLIRSTDYTLKDKVQSIYDHEKMHTILVSQLVTKNGEFWYLRDRFNDRVFQESLAELYALKQAIKRGRGKELILVCWLSYFYYPEFYGVGSRTLLSKLAGVELDKSDPDKSLLDVFNGLNELLLKDEKDGKSLSLKVDRVFDELMIEWENWWETQDNNYSSAVEGGLSFKTLEDEAVFINFQQKSNTSKLNFENFNFKIISSN